MTIASLVRGKRSRSEAMKNARSNGNYVLTDEGRKRISESARQRCVKSSTCWTKPEQQFRDILNEVGLGVRFPSEMHEIFGVSDDVDAKVCAQYPIQRYLCDFVDTERKIVFRVHGDFWHANPLLYDQDNLTDIQKKNVFHDIQGRRYLECKGWQVIDVWESEIYWNKDLVKDRIRAASGMANTSARHAEESQSESGVAHLEDWSKTLKLRWFKNPRKKKETKAIRCEHCGKEYEISVRHKRSENRRFCSSECSGHFARKVERPSKEVLEKDIEELGWLGTGKKYGVSDNSIRKWMKKFAGA